MSFCTVVASGVFVRIRMFNDLSIRDALIRSNLYVIMFPSTSKMSRVYFYISPLDDSFAFHQKRGLSMSLKTFKGIIYTSLVEA